jgi:N-acetylneuraminic acid mutarotase
MKRSISAGLLAAFLTAAMATTAAAADMALPAPVSNNAVALARGPEGPTLYSFLGLGAGKTWRDIRRQAAACSLRARRCVALPDVPVAQGRLAATAATVGGKVYLFGGYSVAKDGTEVSNPETLIFDPAAGRWRAGAPIPVPVDDSLALAYRDRYVYLVSGWHDDGNVARVQVYDSQADRWFEATPYPGTPVFGHAGGIGGGALVVADGVAVLGRTPQGHHRYGLVDEAWRGAIDPMDPAKIAWTRLPPHPGRPAYRMAAVGLDGRVLFAGGTENPYNYNGMGYDGHPSAPSVRRFGYDLAAGRWVAYADKPLASMDHRGMLAVGGKLYILGGMIDGQQVTDRIQVIDAPR